MKKYTLHTMSPNELKALLKRSTYNEYISHQNVIYLSINETPIAVIDCSDSELQGAELHHHLLRLFEMFGSFVKLSR